MFEKMAELIAETLGVSVDEITEDTSFKDDLDADSLDLLDLVMALEDEYDIEITTDDAEMLKTIGDVISFLASKGVEE
ncbi:MAG: acyl carrier protein [Lachnospiraceae bacterium]|nr:acyl carrier protein [Lachnospiraceae bacterium]